MSSLLEKLRSLPWGFSPAAEATFSVINQVASDTSAPELERFAWNQIGGIVELVRDGEPNLMTSSAVNFGFVCGAEYPEEGEPLNDHDVTLQVHYDEESGYQVNVFLRKSGLPTREERERLISAGSLEHFRPRQDSAYFLRSEELASLESEWTEEEEHFRDAIREALHVFVLRSLPDSGES